MAEQKVAKPSKEEIERADQMWANFVVGSKYTIYATAAILVGLALAFVKFV